MKPVLILSLVLLSMYAPGAAQTNCDYACRLAYANKDIAERQGDGSGYLSRAAVYLSGKEYDKAIADCTQALTMPGYGGTVPRGHYEDMVLDTRSQAYFDKGNYQSAIADLSKIIDRAAAYRSGGTSWHWRRANANFNSGNYSAALADYDLYGSYLAAEKESASKYFYLYRGESHLNLKNYDSAIKDFTSAAAMDAKFVEPVFFRGNAFLNKGDLNSAIADYSEAIRLNPAADGVYANRATAYESRKDYSAAIADLTQAIKISPNSANYYKERARLYSLIKEYDSQISDLTQLVRIAPTDAEVYTARAAAYSLKQDYDSAIADYSQAIRLEPSKVSHYLARANAYSDKKDLQSCEADFAAAIKIDPFSGFHSRGHYHERSKRFPEALADFTKAFELNPKASSALLWDRGNVYMEMGSTDIAISEFDAAIKIAPTSALYFEARADAHLKKKNFVAALSDVEKALELSPGSATALLGRGNIRRDQGSFDLALADYQASLEKDRSARAHLNRGMLYQLMKKPAEAAADFRKALELEPDNEEARKEVEKLSRPAAKPKTTSTSRRG